MARIVGDGHDQRPASSRRQNPDCATGRIAKASPEHDDQDYRRGPHCSLDRGEAHIAIRLSRPEDAELTIAKLGTIDFRFYTSPEYLDVTNEENWRFIGYDTPFSSVLQQTAIEAFAEGRSFSFHASSLKIQQAAARAGTGIAALPGSMGMSDEVLVSVPPNTPLIHRDIWLAVHFVLRRSVPVRAVSQHLREIFKTV